MVEFPALNAPLRRQVIALVAIVSLLFPLVTISPAAASASDELVFIDRVNQTRAGVGLPPLTFDVELTNLARSWSSQMQSGVCAGGEFICHASPISAGVTHAWAKLGENVGTGPDIHSVMDAFIASPGHYANIVDPDFTHIGVGVVWDGARLYTTHRFMKLQGAPTTTTTAPTTTTAAPTTTANSPTTTAVAPTTSASPTTPTTTTTAAPEPSGTADDPVESPQPVVVPTGPTGRSRPDVLVGALAGV